MSRAGRLEGKVALIAGAGHGMGRATAYLFAAAAAKVVICARRKSLIEQTARQINEHGGSALALRADVTGEAEARAVIEQTVAAYSRLDILRQDFG